MRQRLRGITRTVVLLAVAGFAVLTVGAASAAKPGSTLATFTTPGTYTWTVPNGVKRVTFDLFGAAGGSESSPVPKGGETTASFNAQPGQVFEVVVGGQGGNANQASVGGFNGGGAGGIGSIPGTGGGGGTDVRSGACASNTSCDLSGRFLVAGGGGGNGLGNGGSGGGYVGGAGDGGGFSGGGGGTQTSGGAAGGTGASDGSFGSGGAGSGGGIVGGGGGGGGWYGGGGGAGGGGGGGSGFIAPWAVFGTMQAGVQSGDGRVVISKA
jgi:hypothetical protein